MELNKPVRLVQSENSGNRFRRDPIFDLRAQASRLSRGYYRFKNNAPPDSPNLAHILYIQAWIGESTDYSALCFVGPHVQRSEERRAGSRPVKDVIIT